MLGRRVCCSGRVIRAVPPLSPSDCLVPPLPAFNGGKLAEGLFLKAGFLITLEREVGGWGHSGEPMKGITWVCFLFSNPIPRFLPSEPLGKQEISKNAAWSNYCEP